ncbi:helix-turn-helix domain-containing protein [Romeria aff. gracilis LEGE 07310]|uniref:Helix-turn-helix domain-containing protein n=1 Tax=Vasconcelosia minhoensis LEGE 07310 TaxID=915328 RepID=A0A8J7D9W7_9CYAN|nr:helix-turn-helix domain-containing protein [Romeria gracilis]MBE9075787.1 helix-turn-helix domain-containing protein [Romeria aff. gracilis LEGE 07310]
MPIKNYRDDLLVRLCDPEYSSYYLKAALDETLEDGNTEAFLLALKNLVDAKGSVQEVASNADISRQHLHRLLSGTGNPTLETLAAVLHAVGLTIDFRPVSEVRK